MQQKQLLTISITQIRWMFQFGFFNHLVLLFGLLSTLLFLTTLPGSCNCDIPVYFWNSLLLPLIIGSWLSISQMQLNALLEGLAPESSKPEIKRYLKHRSFIHGLPSVGLLLGLIALPDFSLYYLYLALAGLVLILAYISFMPYRLKLIKTKKTSSASLILIVIGLLLLPRAAQACSCIYIEKTTHRQMQQLQKLVQHYRFYQGDYPENIQLLEQDARRRGYWHLWEQQQAHLSAYRRVHLEMASQAQLMFSMNLLGIRFDGFPGKTKSTALYRRTTTGYEITGTDRYGHLLEQGSQTYLLNNL